MEDILTVDHLSVGFDSKKGHTSVIDNVNFSIKKGETLCVVGESGCGKSLTSLSIMGLLPKGGRITNGDILFQNEKINDKSLKEMSKIRGKKISMIFQEPMTALNPLHTVGKQISEVIRIHEKVSRREAMNKTIDMLSIVGIPSPEKRVKQYPHELSGGMRQRIMIAMALACKPSLIIADEPTTALDVTIQAQILDLMKDLKSKMGMSLLMITHDLGVVSDVANKVLVMYAGQVVEYGNTEVIFSQPKHPYTQGLIASIPKIDETVDELPIIKGSVPSAEEMPSGCRYCTRCPFAMDICHQQKPPLEGEDHQVLCWLYSNRNKRGEQHAYSIETASAKENS